MDHPYYTVNVWKPDPDVDGGTAWAYDSVEGVAPDPEDDVHLADPLTIDWAFENGVVPGQLVPTAATVRLWCRTAQHVPALQLGDLLEIQVMVGTAGPIVCQPQAMRVAAVELTLTPEDADDYAVLVTITLVDTLAELRGMFPTHPLGSPAGTYGGYSYTARDHAREWWRSRLAEIGALIGRSIGNPDWWNDVEQPHPGTNDGVALTGSAGYFGLAYVDPRVGNWDGKSAHQLLTELLNSHQPGGLTHTIVAAYGSSYPGDFEFVCAPDPGSGLYGTEPIPADPDSDYRYLLVPASRVSAGHAGFELDGDWCEIPARARRSREHVVNTVRLGGRSQLANPADPNLVYAWTDEALEYVNATDRDTYGVSARDLPTALNLRRDPNDNPLDYQAVAPGVVAPRFLTDASARDAGWTYGTFEVVSSRIPQLVAEDLLRYVAPRHYGEADGDGQVLRHVTLTNLDPSIAFGYYTIGDPPEFHETPVTGFVTATTLTVAGDLIWSLTLTPGEPQ